MSQKNILRAFVVASFALTSYAIAQQASVNNLPSNVKVLSAPSVATTAINESEDPKSAVITPIAEEVSAPATAASEAKPAQQSQVQDIGFRQLNNTTSKSKKSTGLENYNQTSIEYYNQWGKKEERAKIQKFYAN